MKYLVALALLASACNTACNGQSEPVAPPPPPRASASAVAITLDAGATDAESPGAPAASISTTGEEGPPNQAAKPGKPHVFVRVAPADEHKAESVDIYADGSVWWKGPGCPAGLMRKIDKPRVDDLVKELERRHFFDMQPVAGPQDVCRTPGAVTVHADAIERSAERSASACSDPAQKRSVDDWKKRVLGVAGEEPSQCKAR